MAYSPNRGRALRLLDLENSILNPLREMKECRDARKKIRSVGEPACFIALGAVAVVIFVPSILLIIGIIAGMFIGTIGLPEYKRLGNRIEEIDNHIGSIMKDVKVQREITDLTAVDEKIQTSINDIRSRATILSKSLRGKL